MKRVRRTLTVIAMAALAAGVLASPASAFNNYSLSFSFGSTGSGNGQFGQFEGAGAIATDSSGNVWVADRENERIQKFNSKGEYLSQIKGEGWGIDPTDIALDSKDNIWVVSWNGQRVVKFSPGGTELDEFGELGSGNGQFWYPKTIAIDSKDNIWVTDTSNYRVQKFDSAGNYLTKFGSEGTGNGQFTYPSGIATDSADNVWVGDWRSEGGRVQEFNSAGSYMGKIGEGQINGPSLDALTIDSKDNLWVSDNGDGSLKVFNAKGEKLTQFGKEGSLGPLFAPWGMAFDSNDNPWVVKGSQVDKWLALPKATTEAVNSIKATQADAKAVVNPNGSNTTYQFEYGTTTSYGSKEPASPTSIGSGTKDVTIGKTIFGLVPGTIYHVRVVATSAAGTTYGVDKTFTTAPSSQIVPMKITEHFDGSATSLANFSSKWSALGWSSGTPSKGQDTATGWGAARAYPAIDGAYFKPVVTDMGTGIAAVATVASSPGAAERYFSLWLDMPSPASSPRAGYELKVTYVTSSLYSVTLSKWVAGTQTVLASGSCSSGIGISFALVDTGDTVSAALKNGSTFTSLLSANDSAFASGKAGVEASSDQLRLKDFKVGQLLAPAENLNAALKSLSLNDAFATNESPLSGGGKWTALGWANSTSGHDTGQVSAGWGPYDAYPTINGAYWKQGTVADTGPGEAAMATLDKAPGAVGGYFSLWLEMPIPGLRHGYQLKAVEQSSGVYEVSLLKWELESKKVLASKSGVSLPLTSKLALVNKAGTVSVWTSIEWSFTQILSAADSGFNGGYTGIEGSGSAGRLKDFKSGQLAPF